MAALLSPANRTKGGMKWGLVVHTITRFAFVTMDCYANFAIQPISYINNRAFNGDGMYPGPFGYQLFIVSEPINVAPSVTFYLNNWLADGLLVGLAPSLIILLADEVQLYRCYVIYGKNWVVALPFLMYLTSLGTYFCHPRVDRGI